MMLNQVASQSHIGTCQQYCMVASAGFRSDTTLCRNLCDRAGGFENFYNALNMESGSASPADMCLKMLQQKHLDDDEDSTIVMLETSSRQDTVAERKIGMRGDLTVQGKLTASMITSPIGDVKVSGELNVMNGIESASARGAFLKVDSSVSIKKGIKSKKDQLLIKGRIDADSVTMDGLEASFLEINSVPQWGLVGGIEDFEEDTADGWSNGEVTECAGQKILGGHCTEQQMPTLTKTFTGLPAHSKLRVSANFFFIDSWDGETGFLNIDGNPMWVESYDHKMGAATGINVCGNATPEKNLMSHIDVTIPHTGSEVTLSFGATLDEHTCDESFGIDSIMLFTR